MKRKILSLVFGALALIAASAANARVNVDIGLYPFGYVAPPPPVVYQPEPYYAPPPVIYFGGGGYWSDEHGRRHRDHGDRDHHGDRDYRGDRDGRGGRR
ncbi:MAG: hypothetical protein ACHP7O_01695 [Burkholderiales bacterium]